MSILIILNIVISIKYLDELQVSINNAEHKIKSMDSKINDNISLAKKFKDQIENLQQNESNLKLQLDTLREENAVLKSNSNRFEIQIIIKY